MWTKITRSVILCNRYSFSLRIYTGYFSCFYNCWVQFSSVTQSCPTLCDHMNRSTPGLPVHHQLLESTQTCESSRWWHPATSSPVVPFPSCPQSLPALGSFPMSQLFTSGGQSIGVSASGSVGNFQWTPRTDLL